MAIYRLEAKAISRGQGRSCVAAAAYRHAATLRDDRQQLTHSYERKEGVMASEIVAPDGAPEWALERGALWNRADAAEKRKDAITAREILLTLPRELSDDQRLALVRDFCRDQFTARGLVADVAIHEPDGLPDPETGETGKQPHAHVMITDRALEGASPTGFASKKDRTLASADGIEALRAAWAEHGNRALERAGLSVRLDHRSLERQRLEAVALTGKASPTRQGREAEIRVLALDRAPEPKIGPVAAAMVREGRGEHAHAWRDVREARRERSMREALATEWRALLDQGRELARAISERVRRPLEEAVKAMARREALAAAVTGPLIDDAIAILNQRQQREAERILAERQRQREEQERRRGAGQTRGGRDLDHHAPRRPPGRDRGGIDR